MGFIDTDAKRKRIQTALALHKDVNGAPYYSGTIDGELGPKSIHAISLFRTDHNLDHPGEPVVDTDLMRELGLLTIQDPSVVAAAKAKGIDLLTLIGLVGPVLALLKGRPMTSDQLGGIVRAVLAAIAGYFVGKGVIDADTAATISGAVATIAVAAWSIFTNRPSKIVPK